MAYTVTREASVFGNKAVSLCDVSADAASGTIPTGLSKINSVALCPQSMATAAIKVSVSGGTVTVSNAASGDVFFLTVIGRR
jgi:hypothetical protein